MLFVLIGVQFAPASMALTCDAVSAPQIAELPCHGEPAQPESPPACKFALKSGQCCCLDAAPQGATDRAPVVPATTSDARLAVPEPARESLAELVFCTSGAALDSAIRLPSKTPLFVSHHALLI